MVGQQRTSDPRAARFLPGGSHTRATTVPSAVGPSARSVAQQGLRLHPYCSHSPHGGLGTTWQRHYDHGSHAIAVESFRDIPTAKRNRILPQHAGPPPTRTAMDRNQTRQVRGHPEGRWALTPRQPVPWLSGPGSSGQLEAKPPVPAAAVNREIRMFTRLVETEQWQVSDLARGRLRGHGHPRAIVPTSRKAGLPAFWRSASSSFSIGDAVSRSRTSSARSSLAMERSTVRLMEAESYALRRAQTAEGRQRMGLSVMQYSVQ
jgi:hypothetical protein